MHRLNKKGPAVMGYRRAFYVLGLNLLFLFDHIKTFAGQLKRRRTKPRSCQKQVVVGPFKQQFGEMIHFRILQETHRSYAGERVLSDDRLDFVVEVYNVGFPEA